MKKITEIRQRLSLSQNQLADALGVTQGAISHYEIGRTHPSPELVQKLIQLGAQNNLVVSFDEIYNDYFP